MTRCSKCGTVYEGWSCPFCAALEEHERNIVESHNRALEEQQRLLVWQKAETASLIEEELEERRRIAKSQEEEHRRTVADAWKLQAESMITSAWEAYRAGINGDALQLALNAAKHDPTAIDSYLIAARVLHRVGRKADGDRYLTMAVERLKGRRYQADSAAHLRVWERSNRLRNRGDADRQYPTAAVRAFSSSPKSWKSESTGELYFSSRGMLPFQTSAGAPEPWHVLGPTVESPCRPSRMPVLRCGMARLAAR